MLTTVLHLTLAVQLATAAPPQPPPGPCLSGELPELRVHILRAKSPVGVIFGALRAAPFQTSPPLGTRHEGWTDCLVLLLRKRDPRPSTEAVLRLPVSAPPRLVVANRWGILKLPGTRPGIGYSSGPFTSLPPPVSHG